MCAMAKRWRGCWRRAACAPPADERFEERLSTSWTPMGIAVRSATRARSCRWALERCLSDCLPTPSRVRSVGCVMESLARMPESKGRTGDQRRPVPDDTDLKLESLARLVAGFLAEFHLRHVTLVCNDWSGAQLVVSPGGSKRVANLILLACEAFDNYPPGLPGRLLCLIASLPLRNSGIGVRRSMKGIVFTPSQPIAQQIRLRYSPARKANLELH